MSPGCRYEALEKRLNHICNSLDLVHKTIIIGDLYMKSITGLPTSYNERLEYHMKHNYNLCQIVKQTTAKHYSCMDLCFMYCPAERSTIWNHWSDHFIAAVSV